MSNDVPSLHGLYLCLDSDVELQKIITMKLSIMKTTKHLSYLLFLFFSISCSLTVDVDDEDELGKISANAIGDNSDGTVSEDGYLDLEVDVFDRDGIGSIRIEIPALNVNFLTTINSFKSSQKVNQTFEVNNIDMTQPKTIFVTLIDNDGNSYTKNLAFETK